MPALARWVFALCVSVSLLSGAQGAPIVRSTTLAGGETTQDGDLTFIVTGTASYGRALELRNNGLRPVVVDSYRTSPSISTTCSGRDLLILRGVSHRICVLPPEDRTGIPSGHATLEMTLLWHELRRPRPVPSPSPSMPLLPSSTPR